MIKIYDGRNEFYQWDLNRQLIITELTVDEIHFSNKMSDKALVVAVKDVEGHRLADVPNILLQDIWPIHAYAYCGDCYTKDCATFKVNARTKPADYVYTETEVKSWDALEEEIAEVKEGLEENIAKVSADVATLENELIETNKNVLANNEAINDLFDISAKQDVRITQIENHINPKYFITDESAAYNKNIPSNACPYIELHNVGSNYISSVEASNNLFNPTIFGTEVDERGYIYYPANTLELTGEITLPSGEYYISTSDSIYMSFGEHTEMSAEFAFTLTETTTIPVSIPGEYIGWSDACYTWVMLNKGNTKKPFEPYREGREAAAIIDGKSTKVVAIEHYGANLVDDEAIFESFGFKKQDNGYWLGTQKIKPIFENKEGKSGAMSISYNGKLITTTSESNSPLAFYAEYTDGTGAWLWQLAFTKNNTDYAIKTATTDATKTVKEIRYGYGVNGTYEIKDLIINWGGVVDYKPFSAEPLFTYEIPEGIQKLTGYGFGTIDFENKKFIQYDGFVGDNPPDRAEHDISAALADFDNIWEVQAGGTLRFVNEAKAAIPSSFTYLAKEDSV